MTCGSRPGSAGEIPAVVARHGMVVSVSGPASEAGAAILAEGGNAVDAAVATALALTVTYPPAGNLGGGGFMMVLPAPGQAPVCVEYRETAPAAAHATMFARDETRLSPKAVGVPGTVCGLALAHSRFGHLAWKDLVRPAERLAREGFAIDAALAKSLNKILTDPDSAPFAELRRVYAPTHGATWHQGDRLVQPDLAHTLGLLANGGPDAFYTGPIADKIVAAMQPGGGLITRQDLADYRPHVRCPIHTTYRGFDIYGPPPPSSGGITLVEMLNIVEPFHLREQGCRTPETVHLMIEAMRRAFLDRARYLGDQDFVAIPEFLTSKAYAARLASGINRQRATASDQLAPDIPLAAESPHTTHFSVVDARGMAVSNTYTLEQSYGSRIMVRQAGFLLNNEMGDFNWTPGYTDRQGRIGTEPNRIAPGKRMLSSQTPVLVLRDGRPFLVTGSPGGRTIINTVFCVVMNVLEFEMDLPQAVAAPRWHQQWLPDRVQLENVDQPSCQDLVRELRARGHEVDPKPRDQGDAHSILVDQTTGNLIGVADPRINGRAVGVNPIAPE